MESRNSPSTANRYFSLIRAIINLAIKKNKYHGINPCTAVERGQENPSRLRYLLEKDIQLIIDTSKDKVREVIACALMTGMRKSEILRIEWPNVDLYADTIHLLMSKSGKPREIPILPALKQLLLSMGPKEFGKVFDITSAALRYGFEKVIKKTGIKDFHFHDLRHTFASHYMMRGGIITDLQHILGHANLAMTLKYAHLSPHHMRKAIQVMDGFVLLTIPQQDTLLLTKEKTSTNI
jgi:integrase